MNKQDPNDAIDRFLLDVKTATERTTRLRRAKLTDQDTNAIAENMLFSVMSAWETFRSDWHFAAINKDPSVFRVKLAGKIEGAIKGKLGSHVSDIVMASIGLPNHFALADVRAILDAEGRNLSFTDRKKVTTAMDDLGPTWRQAASRLSRDEGRLLNLATKCRNAIAHRSDMSMTEFNDTVQEIKNSRAPYSYLGRDNAVRRNAIGSYLKARAVVVNGKKSSRVFYMTQAMKRAAEKFRVP